MRLTLLLCLISNVTFCQTFIPVDYDTAEFIENVNFTLFKNSKMIYSAVTLPDRFTEIDSNIQYDSIIFSRPDYQTLSLLKQNMDSVIFLSRKTISPDEEIAIAGKGREVILGETNRFINDRSRPISRELDFGTIFRKPSGSHLQPDKIVFYVDKVSLKTAYKINFLEVRETKPNSGIQFAEIGNPVFSTDTLYLNPDQSNRVEVNLNAYPFDFSMKQLFVSFQLIDYFDKNNTTVNPPDDQCTKLKFQMSDKADFYAKMLDFKTKQAIERLINETRLIQYDFANSFFLKPHKSILVTPAMLLYLRRQ